MDSTGAGNSLERHNLHRAYSAQAYRILNLEVYPLVLYGGAVGSEDELLRCRGEVGKTGDGQIFVIELRVLAK